MYDRCTLQPDLAQPATLCSPASNPVQPSQYPYAAQPVTPCIQAAANGPRVSSIADFDAQTVVRYARTLVSSSLLACPLAHSHARYFGFSGVEDYYRHLSVGHLGKLARVAVPLLTLHARNGLARRPGSGGAAAGHLRLEAPSGL